jgi:hypothetical protein
MPEIYEGKLNLNPEYNREDNGLYRIGNVNLDDIVSMRSLSKRRFKMRAVTYCEFGNI